MVRIKWQIIGKWVVKCLMSLRSPLCLVLGHRSVCTMRRGTNRGVKRQEATKWVCERCGWSKVIKEFY